MSEAITEAFKKAGHAPPPDVPSRDTEEIAELDPELRRRLEAGQIGGDLVAVTNHAVERFKLRAGLELPIGEVKSELYNYIHRSTYSPRRPDWLLPWYARNADDQERIENHGFPIVDDDLAMPLRARTVPPTPGRKPPRPLTVVTVLYRYA
jgi:hypothetical protein